MCFFTLMTIIYYILDIFEPLKNYILNQPKSPLKLNFLVVIEILVAFCSESFKRHLKILSESSVNGLIKTLLFEAFSEFCLLKIKFSKDTKIYFYKSRKRLKKIKQ